MLKSKPYVFVVCLCLIMIFVFFSKSAQSPRGEIQKAESADDVLTPDKRNADSPKYFLKLQDGWLCAIEQTNGTEKFVRKEDVKDVILTSEEEEKLKEGIFAENYEDLCLYFESYLS